jgi:hypothetical protein
VLYQRKKKISVMFLDSDVSLENLSLKCLRDENLKKDLRDIQKESLNVDQNIRVRNEVNESLNVDPNVSLNVDLKESLRDVRNVRVREDLNVRVKEDLNVRVREDLNESLRDVQNEDLKFKLKIKKITIFNLNMTEKLSTLILTLEEKVSNSEKKISDLILQLQKKEEHIEKLKQKVTIEHVKNKVYKKLIEDNIKIKLSDIVQENKKGLYIDDPSGELSVVVKDYLEGKGIQKNETEETKNKKVKRRITSKSHSNETVSEVENNNCTTYTLHNKKKINKPKQTFRYPTPGELKTQEETDSEIDNIKKIDDKMKKLREDNGMDISYKETIEAVEECFKEMKTTRTYKKSLEKLSKTRIKLLGKINLKDYTELVNKHIKRLEETFSQKYDLKKTKEYVKLSLTPLEQNITQYANYYDVEISPDELSKIKVCLEINIDHPKQYIPFNLTKFCESFYNYGSAVCGYKESIKRFLTNPYGFPNIVYRIIEKSTEEDPYSFYRLDRIDPSGKRMWIMECRLDDFSKNLSNHLTSFYVSNFRKIYFDVFRNHTYTEDYSEKANIFKNHCLQLVQNIVEISKSKSFCTYLQRLIKKRNTIRPTKLDTFNIISDDKSNKTSFEKEKDDPEDVKENLKKLFDGITEDELEAFCTANI